MVAQDDNILSVQSKTKIPVQYISYTSAQQKKKNEDDKEPQTLYITALADLLLVNIEHTGISMFS